jgi:carbonic anhydrase
VHLLRVARILIVQHTRCAMAGGDDAWMRQRVAKATGADLTGFHIGADPNQLGRVHADAKKVRTHQLIAGRAQVGGFLYNVDSGLLEQHV